MLKVSDQHLKWIDAVRVFAILGVIICHVTEMLYEGADLNDMGSRMFIFLCHAIGRLGVPLFLMITGYLLLDRDYNEELIKKFWIRKWLNLLACTGIWFVIYEIYLFAVGRGTTDPIKLIEELTITRNIDISHTWYMGMILGIYILIPFASIALKSVRPKLFLFPFVIYAVYEFGRNTVNTFIEFIHPEYQMNTQFVLGFSGGVWGIYLVVGYFIKKGALKKLSSFILGIAAFTSLIMPFMFMMIQSFYGAITDRYVWYDNVFVFIPAVLFFEIFTRLKIYEGIGYSVTRFIAKYTFPVFLTHLIFMEVFKPYVMNIGCDKSVMTLILCLIGLGLGLLLSWLLARIPKAGKYITYVKD